MALIAVDYDYGEDLQLNLEHRDHISKHNMHQMQCIYFAIFP